MDSHLSDGDVTWTEPTTPLTSAGRIQRSIARGADDVVERLIRAGKISKPSWWISQRGRLALFLALLASCLAAAIVYQAWLSDSGSPGDLPGAAAVGTALIAITVSTFGYLQWNDSRRELSLDRFYDRLRLVNERFYEWNAARELVSHYWPNSDVESFQKAMYVYLELDNLEYIVLRYQLGFVSRTLLRRAVRTFSSRCESEAFSSLAIQLVQGAGYAVGTIKVVEVLTRLARQSTLTAAVPT